MMIINDFELNLDFQEQFRDNQLKNELLRLQKENVSLRVSILMLN